MAQFAIVLICFRYLVQGHPVELDGLGVLAQLEVDVAHVDLQPPRVVEHPVLGDYLQVESLGCQYGHSYSVIVRASFIFNYTSEQSQGQI